MSLSMKEFFANHQLLLAPMAGITDRAFRSLCIECGASLAYSEMISAKGLSFASDKTKSLLALAPGEEKIAIQIFGHEAQSMAAEAFSIQELLGDKLAYLDINMGCPAKKITKKGDGAALMKDPELAACIVSAVSSRISSAVTVKFRRGYSVGSDTAVDFARRIEDAGASALAVHGRYAEQFYRGKADWNTVALVKRAVSIPVIGNGDIKGGEDILELKKISNCDAFMIGRAARGCPWVFRTAQAALDGREGPADPRVSDRIEMARRHARLLEEYHGREVVRMRKHAMYYVAGLPGASQARNAFNSCTSYADFDRVFDELLALSEEVSCVSAL